MTDIEKRVEALESHIFTKESEITIGIYYVVVDGRAGAPSEPKPVKGWKYSGHVIMRLDGESDEELKERAFDEVKPFLRRTERPVFHPILDGEDE